MEAFRVLSTSLAFRAILPQQEVELEISTGAGKSGDWLVCAPNGTAVPITNGASNGGFVAGMLLEGAEPGDVARILFWPVETANLSEEQVLVP